MGRAGRKLPLTWGPPGTPHADRAAHWRRKARSRGYVRLENHHWLYSGVGSGSTVASPRNTDANSDCPFTVFFAEPSHLDQSPIDRETGLFNVPRLGRQGEVRRFSGAVSPFARLRENLLQDGRIAVHAGFEHALKSPTPATHNLANVVPDALPERLIRFGPYIELESHRVYLIL